MKNQDSKGKKSAENRKETKDLDWAFKTGSGAGILPAKFQLEGPSRLMSN